MNRQDRRRQMKPNSNKIPPKQNSGFPIPKTVDSLLDIMKDGHEYESIVSHIPPNGQVIPDIQRAVREIQSITGRPLICYLGNVIQLGLPGTSIDFTDDLPFNEMISKIPEGTTAIDVMIVTPGGLGQQVSQFVNALRKRFETVEFILPYMCMSAGTLWALSGDRIWMDSRAFIGPIDPQVRSKSGEFVPAQSILILLEKIKAEGEIAIKNGQNPPWHLVRLIDVMDPRHVGEALTASGYSIKLATDFLNRYKFKHWITHSNGNTVTPEERIKRASEVASKLCDNAYWKSHGHGISREAADNELKLKIVHLESDPDLQRAVRRFWALMYYLFEKTMITKCFFSDNYVLMRQVQNAEKK